MSFVIVTLTLWLLSIDTFAMGGSGKYADPIAPIILWVTTILFCAVIGRFAARKLNMPTVLGELGMGIFIGNFFYYLGIDLFVILREGPVIFDMIGEMLHGRHIDVAVQTTLGDTESAKMVLKALEGDHGLDLLKVAHVVDIFSRYGVIFLLFLVGLDSSVDDIRATGKDAVKVATIGVLAPIALGFIVVNIFEPDYPLNTDLFIAAALSATSIGITARVLKDLKRTNARETHVILGAAMIDDILGLIILAIITGIIVSGGMELHQIIRIFALASLFISSAIVMGPFLLDMLVRLLRHMDVLEAKLFISFLFVMMLAWFANLLGLATIVGAFAAGVILHDGYFETWKDDENSHFRIKDLVAPLEAILAPLFFILIGIQVKLELFFDTRVFVLAIALLIAAIVGKLLAGLGADKKLDRWSIGFGMMPRGEVGLVFASIGKSLGVINDLLFAAIILMVIVTTLVAPPLLKWRIQSQSKSNV